MSSTKHREVAKLDRVPLPVEAARMAVTGWQVTRTAARVVAKLPGKGPLNQKVIKQLPQTFAELGPTYVKFGQIIASSPGAFGESLSREFRGLLDRVPPADSNEVHKLLAEELGGEPSELFAKWDEEPFASASIAQVHYATLHTGEDVVVKIQRPGIRRRVAADLQILKRFAQAVELAKLGRRLSAQDVVADFSGNLAEELNFRLEAQSMEAWVTHLHPSPLGKNIRVPQVFWDFTSDRVLTMERVHGIRIDDLAAIRKAGFDGTELVKALLFSLFEGGLRHGLFHGDLHAGNLYVDDQGRIVFFDFGIMGRIDPRTRWLLRELVYALLVKKDHAAAGKIVVLMGAVGTVKPEAEAAKDLERFATPLTMSTLGDMSYADLGRQLSTLADAYDVKLPRELVLIGKQFLYVERYMKLLAPKWQMMSDPQLTGYFANFMVEVSREHDTDLET
ncbi:Predicted unusual protein kinase regulating ubiquinone biosynthesis, AarF/ABC1/UbiB family [Mycobacterium rhizamassiliense]|jgi:predicted unusual protein kinase regulating ubiquinone biosynthesis (AarF/ABC1/UbiB family)|uniref:Predicted unusual protein kinase regulating ubiquinone biosynthesis, AarF/ABC1/UbiB family n=1 Tax=Mycobacterium rhizamassiliense TaxID=1841860 RepID=A0A2U3NN20_9MYCO|nr:AarF/ABC1/UbiB kinase family protein [Mycobacterium rhizamassiliense]SPM32906.1 Predicted unusual protein kinase regulating ubiquinone biosynthesis, AarF/ABC1/UbiB family [Mycobacterium rhizamassiliense]